MVAVRKRTTVTATGTPEYVASLFSGRHPEIPSDAVIVDVELRTDDSRSIESVYSVTRSSHITFTLEWPDEC